MCLSNNEGCFWDLEVVGKTFGLDKYELCITTVREREDAIEAQWEEERFV